MGNPLHLSRLRMAVAAAVIAWGVGAMSAAIVDPGFGLDSFIPSGADAMSIMASELHRSGLSPEARIILPSNPLFPNVTQRWQTYADPAFALAVEVATENDISLVIHAANKHNKYFLAVSGGHGAIDSLRHMQNGVEIWMRRLNYVHINSDGKTATMGGGLLSKEITDALWAHKKQTVTGACECVGLLGPALGGGHGWLQGRLGLAADNIVSARLVLANGTAVTVSSQTNPDLYWALKGAGHNFGVVSELTYNIYDVPAGNIWTYESFTFSADKVEQVFDVTNELTAEGTQDVAFINFSFFVRIPAFDAVNPVIKFFVLYEGTPDREARFGAPYHKIGPLNVVTGTATYPELSALTGNGNNDIACQHNYAALRFPISLRSYNLVAQRSIFDQFAQITAVQPLFNNSVFLFEGYSLRAVKAVPSDSTAFPDRQDNLLVSPVFIYPTNSSLDAQAIAAGQEIRQTLLHGSGSSDLNAYVNYAHGDETLQELYGHDSWRVPKLQELKKHYDPHGRFNFYAPITTS